MVEFLGFDWTIVELVAACAIAGFILCLFIHLFAAVCGWDSFFSCYGACGRALCTCCGLRSPRTSDEERDEEEEVFYKERLAPGPPRRQEPSRGRRRAGGGSRGGGGNNSAIVGPLVTVEIQNNAKPDERGEGGSVAKPQRKPGSSAAGPEEGNNESGSEGERPLLPLFFVWNSRV
mgnify:CR=1 FL=1